MELFFHTALEWLSEGRRVSWVTVIETKGSTPRHPGAMMLVDESGTLFQTIGGGAVENEVTQIAKDVALSKKKAHIVHRALGTDLAMCCGGQMTFLIEPLKPCQSLFMEVQAALQAGQTLLLRTDLKTFHKTIEQAVSKRDSEDSFLQVIKPSFRLALFGCGHVGKEIGALAAKCGFQIVACDDNHTGELEQPLPWASKTVASFEWTDVFAESHRFSELDMVLIVTRDHEKDERLLKEAMNFIDSLGYLGLIGSKGKLGRFTKRLKSQGIQNGWEKLHCPIGLNIGAETPIEIAVSVMAELVQVRNRLQQKTA